MKPALPRVAYFCMEFALHEDLPIYAGGLGVLAGDHIKAAHDAIRASDENLFQRTRFPIDQFFLQAGDIADHELHLETVAELAHLGD